MCSFVAPKGRRTCIICDQFVNIAQIQLGWEWDEPAHAALSVTPGGSRDHWNLQTLQAEQQPSELWIWVHPVWPSKDALSPGRELMLGRMCWGQAQHKPLSQKQNRHQLQIHALIDLPVAVWFVKYTCLSPGNQDPVQKMVQLHFLLIPNDSVSIVLPTKKLNHSGNAASPHDNLKSETHHMNLKNSWTQPPDTQPPEHNNWNTTT